MIKNRYFFLFFIYFFFIFFLFRLINIFSFCFFNYSLWYFTAICSIIINIIKYSIVNLDIFDWWIELIILTFITFITRSLWNITYLLLLQNIRQKVTASSITIIFLNLNLIVPINLFFSLINFFLISIFINKYLSQKQAIYTFIWYNIIIIINILI
jgi:hypothetical protein